MPRLRAARDVDLYATRACVARAPRLRCDFRPPRFRLGHRPRPHPKSPSMAPRRRERPAGGGLAEPPPPIFGPRATVALLRRLGGKIAVAAYRKAIDASPSASTTVNAKLTVLL